jgi:tetratricopeptide (TPR) repeat protein
MPVVEELRDHVINLTSSIRSDSLAQAMGYLVTGMAEKELHRYTEAERAVRRALHIHERYLYLEEAAYNWFFIASIYSVSGRFDDALAALRTSIEFDRRAENGFGIASSWQAMGEVFHRAGNPAESHHAFTRAADIFRAIGLEEEAARAEQRAAQVQP